MSKPIERSLLRRTFGALLAAAGMLLASAPSFALTVTLNGPAGSPSCTYSSMSVTPDGNVSVSCQATTANDPGTFTLSIASTMGVNSMITGSVNRSGGTTGAVNVSYSISGAGCAAGSGTVTFQDASSTAQTFQVASGATGGTTCTVTLSNPSAGVLGAPSSASISVGTTAPPPPPPPSNNAACPTGFTQPADMVNANFQGVGQWWPQLNKSRQIVSIPLPAVSSGHYSGQAAFGENIGAAYTPQPVTLEITISQCPGFIDVDTANPTNTHPNNNYCNLRSPNGTYNQITWFGKAYSTLNSATVANAYGYCWAPEGGAQWYLNARWTYNSCPYGQASCGFAIQQNLGPY